MARASSREPTTAGRLFLAAKVARIIAGLCFLTGLVGGLADAFPPLGQFEMGKAGFLFIPIAAASYILFLGLESAAEQCRPPVDRGR